ncbi:CNH domain-containing protein [Globomyces pollinis-pini]|nr:CNH domain-containing protein [Globomyces pollinis-pini]
MLQVIRSYSFILDFWASEEPISFQSADLCGADLYIGLSDGTLAHYTVEQLMDNDQNINSTLKNRISVSTSKTPCIAVKAVPSESKLITLSDSILNFYNIETLTQSSLSPVRGCMAFCIDQYMQSPLGLLVAKKKSIGHLKLDNALTLKKSIPVEETVLVMTQYNNSICTADSKMYNLVSFKREQSTPLFPYDYDLTSPVVTVISENEFLLVTASAQGFGIGVFISSSGEPVRGTLQWPVIPVSIVYQAPYILSVLKNSTVQIHHIETQSLIQSIPIASSQPPKFFCLVSYPIELTSVFDNDDQQNEESTIPSGSISAIIGTIDGIFGLVMVPWDAQIQELFSNNEMEQAIALLESTSIAEESETQMLKRQKFHRIAGFHFLEKLDFEMAFKHFRLGYLNPKYLIQFYPIQSSNISLENDQTFASDTIQRLESLNTLITNHILLFLKLKNEKDIENMTHRLHADANSNLIAYLEFGRSMKTGPFLIEDIDTALVKLYAITESKKLIPFLQKSNNALLEECTTFLMDHSRYYALSLMHKSHNDSAETLDLWIKLASGDLTDPEFLGFSLIIDYLIELSDKELVLRYSNWVLRRDPTKGVKIFTDRKDNLFESEAVLVYLESFGSKPKQTYIEYLVLKQHNKDPQLHTQLAIVYLERIIRFTTEDILQELDQLFIEHGPRKVSYVEFLNARGDPICIAKLQFYHFLYNSKLIKIEEIKKILDNEGDLYYLENLCLASMEKQHDRVLEIYVHHLHDAIGAYTYCVDQEGDIRNRLLHQLVNLYLSSR